MITVCIAGLSASGKTTFAESLKNILLEKNYTVQIMGLDRYYHNKPDNIGIKEYKATSNFDDPKFMDFDFLKSQIIDLKNGRSIEMPSFNFKTEQREKETVHVDPPQFLLLEGTASLYFYEQYLVGHIEPSQCYKVFVEGEHAQILEWRIQRNMRERGYANVIGILDQDEKYVWPTYEKFILPTKKSADLAVFNKPKEAGDTSLPLYLDASKTAETLIEKFHHQEDKHTSNEMQRLRNRPK